MPGSLLLTLSGLTSFTRLMSLICERPETAQDKSVGQFWTTYFAASFPVKPGVSNCPVQSTDRLRHRGRYRIDETLQSMMARDTAGLGYIVDFPSLSVCVVVLSEGRNGRQTILGEL